MTATIPFRRIDPGDLRPIYGAAAVRRPMPRWLPSERAKFGPHPRNRGWDGRGHQGAASCMPDADRRHRPQRADVLSRRRSRIGPRPFRPADALDYRSRRDFDLVVCQFGVMFFPDKVRANSEARRVLRDGGRYLLVIWDRIEHNPGDHGRRTRGGRAVPRSRPPRSMSECRSAITSRADRAATCWRRASPTSSSRRSPREAPPHPSTGRARAR